MNFPEMALRFRGTSVEQGIKNGLLTGLLNTAASGSAKWIGENGPDGLEGSQNLNRLAAEVAHAIAGCAVGAGRASGGGGVSGSAGCKAGAVGAFAGHLTGQLYNPNADPEYAERTIKLGQMVSGVAGALVGGTQEAADIAAAAGANAVENNWMSGAQKKQRAAELATCGKGAAALSCQLKVAERWIQVDASQQVVFDNLTAAKDRVVVNPTPANLAALDDAIAGMASLFGGFEATGDKGAGRTLSAALVPAVLLRGQSCAVMQGACGPITLSTTERHVVGQAFSDFGFAADGNLGAGNLRNMQAIGEAIASGGASTWKAIADASKGLSDATKLVLRPASGGATAAAAAGEVQVPSTVAKLPGTTDGTASSPYSSEGVKYGTSAATDAAGTAVPTVPSVRVGAGRLTGSEIPSNFTSLLLEHNTQIGIRNSKAGTISGAHNHDSFLESIEITGAKILNKITDVRFPGLVEYTYQLPRVDAKGDLIGGYKPPSTKTTYKSSVISDNKIAELSSRAAIEAELILKGDLSLQNLSVKVDGYYFQVTRNKKTNEITNSFVTMPPRSKQ
ncbi:CdiA family toxin C-terminal domain-containing protein [Variovorax sp. H27-G14]|uniref:CdiA family toxin C-terminal domain-containing protein n=1 Tax=Variovorax sp. H27-G14 TaxID=3111914 RepID=UPI0038FCDA23